MSKKQYFGNMRIAEKFSKGKSADISQNVHLDELFQNLKKKLHGISLRGLSSTL